MRLLQLDGTFLTTDLDGLSADSHLDGAVVQRVVACGTGSLAHVVLQKTRKPFA